MQNDKVFVPPIKIQGIKTKLVPLIEQNVILDESAIWYEPFMGSGVVGFNVAPKKAVFGDINPHIIHFYNAIKSKKIDSYLVREFLEEQGAKLSEKDAKYYYEVRERFNQSHEPLDFLFLNRSCFNGMIRFNKSMEFNVPYGHKPQRFSKSYVTKVVNQVKYVEDALKGNDWVFVCQPFEKAIEKAGEKDFIYCDPPYIGRHVDYYDSWNEDSEYALCAALKKTNAKFMLSTWDHNAYRTNEYLERVWGFCHKTTKEHFYYVGAREKNRNPMLEALLTNYVPCRQSNTLALSRQAQVCLPANDE
ncbi:MAG: Dam family site-specific DNA-(adenine-N6)-methyltransferase [Faecalibacterium sp.]|jgi:DNA adenine methylase|nr:Dam family site-specific DNA-(adenine-N6)-methyltransferase [Faecalibacterium sp.]